MNYFINNRVSGRLRQNGWIMILPILFMMSSCVKDVSPSDSLTTGTLTSTTTGLEEAVDGAYALMKDQIEFNGSTDQNNMYLRQYFECSDFAGDDIVCGQTTTDPLYYSFSLGHVATQSNMQYFWYISYKIVSDVNTVMESINAQSNLSTSQKQLLGECYFLRAFAFFNLTRFFAQPYTISPSSDGIILRTSTSDPSAKARASVKDTYAQIIADAEMGASLMDSSRGVIYGTREAAWSLLSRAFLYEDNTDSTIYYSNQVVNSGKFGLTTASTFPTMFANAQTATETIFCIAFTTAEDYGKFGSIASMVYTDGNSGWGEEYASSSLRDTMSSHPEDVRWSYILVDTVDGVVQKKNGIEKYYIYKFSGQDGSATLSSPIMFRLAEIYLNRAEAYAKAGNTAAALADVDLIRTNRGLSSSLYNGTLPAGMSILDVVLKERRLELAFEGHRPFDVYRNKLNLNRTYWGYHLSGLQESDIDLTTLPSGYTNEIVDYTNPKIIYYIPQDEINSNSLCTQNP